MAEFDGLRSKLYSEAIREYPFVRAEDVELMVKYLNPCRNETILGVGEGNGFFAPFVKRAIGAKGTYVVTDPSKDQLFDLSQDLAGCVNGVCAAVEKKAQIW
ncbi:hypothetical protein HN587_00370 [Candidatus Woesearchaeota archaeon]|jgi:hypothetical protein|nr:hypothetical protein [Candidatus Woesearchaeota archaeon]